MKKMYFLLALGCAGLMLLAGTSRFSRGNYGLVKGTPEIKSISGLAFGPDGILLVGDSKSATVFAIDTKDAASATQAPNIEIKNIDQKIAALLGTDAQNITIQDIAVNPISKNVYCAVQSGDGTPVLFKIAGDKIEAVSTKDVMFSSLTLNGAPSEEAKDKRGNSLRVSAISDIGFADGKVLVSGLSGQEFASTFRSIPFPFSDKQDQATLEIYHAAHGKYETLSPIRTFTTAEISGKKYLVASYTCTPLVLFPLDELKPGSHVKGRTVAEMGSGNSPIDMVTMKKGTESFLMMANSSRPVFKVKYKSIETFQGSLTTPVEENFATAGVDFVSLPVTNVIQLDKLDDTRMVLLQRRSNGSLDLWTSSERYL
ncbi:hypothetical protein [Dyadobacter fanqingshengii]|uniref:WD40 repeat domain-containing protein n=1 Tax=Dyadobacter fanqingshengii TaxID=2906443 RepID=A0A9X1TFU0_9BACT|nr:hypothetical protein [Dyadobacter fanqingshengii]MCF0039847.1 hypothetical protein [Dyadobacter fanqingshengii]MCF2502653.1 hypothetical protein [Dyadobacter fanqingshengii]USJ38391.1 hypothetical protein NFI81_11545 [Dyadobacter fanqingshengii]